jgi:hypothetical protein
MSRQNLRSLIEKIGDVVHPFLLLAAHLCGSEKSRSEYSMNTFRRLVASEKPLEGGHGSVTLRERANVILASVTAGAHTSSCHA